eukprot:1645369-Prymnesium_polylepis.1
MSGGGESAKKQKQLLGQLTAMLMLLGAVAAFSKYAPRARTMRITRTNQTTHPCTPHPPTQNVTAALTSPPHAR